MASFKDLRDFVDLAEKNRKYAKGTAQGRRVALKMFEPELNEDESKSLDLFEQRFDSIYKSVFQKNKTKISTTSWETYRKRIRALIKDYKLYGIDPGAFNAWDSTRKVEPRKKKAPQMPSGRSYKNFIEAEVVNNDEDISEQAIQQIISDKAIFNSELNKVEVFIRPGFRVSLVLPVDLKQAEANRLIHMISGMVSENGTTD